MNKKESNFVSAVVYLSDDSKDAGKFLGDLLESLNAYFQHYELVVVNDCCKKQDEVLKKLLPNESNNMITVIHMSMKQGVEVCLSAGLDVSIGDFVFEFDSMEFSFSKELLWSVYQKALEGNDIVSVETTCNSFSRRTFYKLFNRYSTTDYDINASAFRLVSRRAINRVLDLKISCAFRQAMYASCGLKNARIEFEGQANTKKSRGLDLAIDSFLLYTSLPKKLSITAIKGLFVFVLVGIVASVLNLVYAANVWDVLFKMDLVYGCSIIGCCLIGGLFYGQLLLKESRNKYLFENIEKIQR